MVRSGIAKADDTIDLMFCKKSGQKSRKSLISIAIREGARQLVRIKKLIAAVEIQFENSFIVLAEPIGELGKKRPNRPLKQQNALVLGE